MSLRYSEIFLNADTRQRVTVVNDATSTLYLSPDSHFQGDYELIRFHVLDRNADYLALDETSDIYFVISKADTAIAESYNSSVNVSGDWAEASKADGKLSVRVDLDSSAVDTAIGNAASVAVTSELWYRANGEQWQLVGQYTGKLYNTVAPDDSDMSSASSGSSSSSSSSEMYSNSSDSSVSSGSSNSSDSSDSSESSISSDSSSSSSEIEATLLRYDFSGMTPEAPTYIPDGMADNWTANHAIVFEAVSGRDAVTGSSYSMGGTKGNYHSFGVSAASEVYNVDRIAFRLASPDADKTVGWAIDYSADDITYNEVDTGTIAATSSWQEIVADASGNLFASGYWRLHVWFTVADMSSDRIAIANVRVMGALDSSSSSGA